MLNFNNPTQGTQCGVNENPTTQRPGGTRQWERLEKNQSYFILERKNIVLMSIL